VSNSSKALVYEAMLAIKSSMTLTELAARLSEKLFGGMTFVSTDRFDELDGLQLAKPVLGFDVTLTGFDGNYMLELKTDASLYMAQQLSADGSFRRLDEYIVQCLLNEDDITASSIV
jgi:hypothetical protein